MQVLLEKFDIPEHSLDSSGKELQSIEKEFDRKDENRKENRKGWIHR